MSAPENKVRVLVIDDSAFNRQAITAMLSQDPEVEVVGRAHDGEEGLRQVFALQPDVVTVDLEMPRMDGFAFLRLLMATRPTPVLVISGHASRENVFRALDLGAVDFVAKPYRQVSAELHSIKDDLLAKLRSVKRLRVQSLAERAARATRVGTSTGPIRIPSFAPPQPARRSEGVMPPTVLALGASTGGPPAITQLLGALEPSLGIGVVITQHMPVRFTRAFAERLARVTAWEVLEAEPGDVVTAGRVLVAPGSGSLTLSRAGSQLRAEIVPQRPGDRFIPSVDQMLESLAVAAGPATLAVILTGMGGDGSRGVLALKAAGGAVFTEDPQGAVVPGMPEGAIATGAVDRVVPLGQMADALVAHIAAAAAQRR
jgi:two-component system chemotaxis response regulator CheB